ncbi:MAG: molybdopterin-dependent oxidoreductase, partial [Anaerolineales bacterium]|nr:molybdopterin-dependent oxidoreductase [Anaerolineales bacterium]
TNLPPGKPFRAPGGLAACWVIEQAADQIAHERGVDPVAVRRPWGDNDLRTKLYDWVESLPVWRERPPTGSQSERFRRGVGVAFGQWIYAYDPATEIRLDVDKQGLTVTTATQDIGNGVRTTLARTVAAVFGLQPQEVRVVVGNSSDPHGPTAGGSRVTNSVFAPTREAAELMRDRLFGLVAEAQELEGATAVDGGIQHSGGLLAWRDVWPQVEPQQVAIQRGTDNQLVQRIGHFVLTRIIGTDFTLGLGNSHGAIVAEVEVDTLLGKTRVLNMWINIAAGKIHVPDLARSQVYGGVAQGLGYALYEEKVTDPHTGHNLTLGLEDYRLVGVGDMPEVHVTFTEGGFEQAKGEGIGLAELAITPVPAAVANAVFNATGWRPLTNPIQPERLLMGLQGQEA